MLFHPKKRDKGLGITPAQWSVDSPTPCQTSALTILALCFFICQMSNPPTPFWPRFGHASRLGHCPDPHHPRKTDMRRIRAVLAPYPVLDIDVTDLICFNYGLATCRWPSSYVKKGGGNDGGKYTSNEAKEAQMPRMQIRGHHEV